MLVMSNHKWKDPDIECVVCDGNINNREIDFTEPMEAIVINKEDVIALAHEFGLTVYDKSSTL